MTRNEYLEQLSNALAFLKDEVRQAILAFYGEMLDDRIEEGMSEQDAVADMENVHVIADRMRQEHGAQETRPEQNNSAEALMPCTITYSESDLSSLRCVFIDRPVILEGTNESSLSITYTENVHAPLEYIETNGHLSLTEKTSLSSKQVSLFGISFGNVLDSLFRAAPLVDPTVRIKIPSNILMDLHIVTTNGKVTLTNLLGAGGISLNSSNGGVHLAHLRCKQITCKTSNARVVLDQVSAAHQITVRSSNGRIEAAQVQGDAVDLGTSNARIRADSVLSSNTLRLHTSNGHIETRSCAFQHLDLITSNGGISGTLPGSMTDYTIDSRTSNGFNSLPQHQEGGSKHIRVHTSNGAIHIGFENVGADVAHT